MLFFELLGCFVELNLGCLGLGDLLVEVSLLTTDLNCEFFNLKIELLDFCIVFLSELLQRHIVLFFLLAGNCPQLKLFLIPIKLQFQLFTFFTGN